MILPYIKKLSKCSTPILSVKCPQNNQITNSRKCESCDFFKWFVINDDGGAVNCNFDKGKFIPLNHDCNDGCITHSVSMNNLNSADYAD